MVIDYVLIVFLGTIGGMETLYSLFALYSVIMTGAIFYKIATI
jgi:hypothetical protein